MVWRWYHLSVGSGKAAVSYADSRLPSMCFQKYPVVGF